MKINRDNYEAFFVDYHEGKLDANMVDDFIEFLQQNPDLKEELSLFESVSILPEEINFGKKELLFKEKFDIENEFNKAAIATLEGEIPALEKSEFEDYLSSHPEKLKEAQLFEKTKLRPDTTIVFGKKNKLYRRSAGRTVLLWSMRVAAVIIVALSVYTFIDSSSDKIITEGQLAVAEKETVKKENNTVAIEIPEKTDKKEVQPLINIKTEKQAIKEGKTNHEPLKSFPENSKVPTVENNLASVRTADEMPTELRRINPKIYAGLSKTDLVPVNFVIPETLETIYDEKLLVDVIKEKTGIENLTFNKITKAGLSLVSSLSKEKFNYETNNEGKITEIKYDSRILAFSIPTKNEVDGK